MVVGEAPGPEEHRSGQPLSGDAGQKLRKLFAELGVSASDFDAIVYPYAAALCFPGRINKDIRRPSNHMIENCLPFFKQKIDICQPKILVLMGATSFETWRNKIVDQTEKNIPNKITQATGSTFNWKGTEVIPIMHTSGRNAGDTRQTAQLKALDELRIALRKHKLVSTLFD